MQLERELARQTVRADKAEAIVTVQKKLGELLGLEMPADPVSTVKR